VVSQSDQSPDSLIFLFGDEAPWAENPAASNTVAAKAAFILPTRNIFSPFNLRQVFIPESLQSTSMPKFFEVPLTLKSAESLAYVETNYIQGKNS
jgi:hypothetical protein